MVSTATSTPVVATVTLKLGAMAVTAYQLQDTETPQVVFTHRQIGDAVGRSKGTVQKFCKAKAEALPPPVSAKLPDKPRPVNLSTVEAALSFWQTQADGGNETAQTLMSAVTAIEGNLTAAIESAAPSPASGVVAVLNSPELHHAIRNLESLSEWLIEAGVSQSAIALWRFNQLRLEHQELAGLADSALQLIARHNPQPAQGMIASQVAKRCGEELDQKVTAAQVNAALHELGMQDWLKKGSRERKLTQKGQQYGQVVLTTSRTNQWQGAQLLWSEEIVPVLVAFFQEKEESSG